MKISFIHLNLAIKYNCCSPCGGCLNQFVASSISLIFCEQIEFYYLFFNCTKTFLCTQDWNVAIYKSS